MSVLKRMSDVVQEKLNSVLAKAEDPNEALDLAYQKQLESLQQVRRLKPGRRGQRTWGRAAAREGKDRRRENEWTLLCRLVVGLYLRLVCKVRGQAAQGRHPEEHAA